MGTEFIKILTKEHRDALSKARKTYGTTNQILVSNEELCELAAVCAKYPRYSTSEKAQEALYDKALGEQNSLKFSPKSTEMLCLRHARPTVQPIRSLSLTRSCAN